MENVELPSLTELLRELASLTGEPMGEPEGEHDRWRLYQRATAVPSAVPGLWRAITAEPVLAVASAAVVMLLEQTDRDDRGRLIDLLDPAVREFPEERAREIRILESIREKADRSDIGPEDVDTWSDWLQLGVVGSTRSRPILDVLAEHGRTKRIRRLARDAQAWAPEPAVRSVST
jgi:hypothetical protein